MTGKDAGMIEQIGGNIEHFAGKEVRDKVMEGSEQITRQDDPAKTSEWVKQAIEKLDTLVDERTRIRIMEHCGYNCATINKDHIEKPRQKAGNTKT